MGNNENIMINMLTSLNEGVIIKPSVDDKLMYICSIPCEQLRLPRRFTYNSSKNIIINNKTGNSIIIKYDLEKAKEDLFEPKVIEEIEPYMEPLREESVSNNEDLFKTETISDFDMTHMKTDDTKNVSSYDEFFESTPILEYKETYKNDNDSETISEYRDLTFDKNISHGKLPNSGKKYSEDYAKYVYGIYNFNSKSRLKRNAEKRDILPIIDTRKELIKTNIELVRRCLELIKYLDKEDIEYDSELLTSLIVRFERATHEDNAINELNYIKDKLFLLSNSLCNKFLKKEHLHNKKNSI